MAAEDPAAKLFHLINGYQLTQALHAAAVLGVADQLKDRARSADELAKAIGTHPRSLYRLLRALAAAGVLHEDEERRFALTELGEPLRSDHPRSVAAWATLIGRPYQWQSWGQLLHGVRTGRNAFFDLHGTDVWTWRAWYREESAVFDRAMTATTRISNAAILAAYDFSSFERIVDVGGGHGAFLSAILEAHPKARGVLFDQPHVVAGAEPLLRDAGVRDRCEITGGNLFDAVPRGGDAYTLRGMLCDYDDAVGTDVLRICRRAMAPSARLLIIDRVAEPPNAGLPGKLFDLYMFVMTTGEVRTREEFEELLEKSGFRLLHITRTQSAHCVIEAAPV